ncbi:hypothetical protein ACKA06_17255 [Rossellomorea oryzaecorticis]|uniref:Fur-regulated basic protein FbpA n=1 Tax=Rossellomorea oryzaecorticis TaxID=1396505 RepID=A0ABW8VVC5_9BACI
MKDRRAKRLIYCAYILNKIGLLDYSQMKHLEKQYSKKRDITE